MMSLACTTASKERRRNDDCFSHDPADLLE
jgi:hypothetical protein